MHNEKAMQWEAILAEFKTSKLSAAAFCRDKQYSFHQFQYWKKRLKARLPDKHDAFIKVDAPPLAASSILIHHGDYRIELPEGVAPDTLQRVIRSLK